MAGTAKDTRPTVEGTAESLTGFDEIAIEKWFTGELSTLSGTKSMRALAFVLARRDGKADKEAYGDAMRATLKEITESFADIDTGDEGDDAGKD